MQIGKQIKKLRSELGLSQEELADKVFVTRQTISNWETNKNYPDINSIILLSQLFGISLDILVKGDIEEMKEQIQKVDVQRFHRDSIIFSVLLVVMVISIVPLFKMLDGFIGIGIWLIIVALTLYYAMRVEKQKKEYNVQTYKEIVAFSEGKRLDEIEKIREEGKRPYQKFLYVIGAGVIGFIATIIMFMLFKNL